MKLTFLLIGFILNMGLYIYSVLRSNFYAAIVCAVIAGLSGWLIRREIVRL